MNLFMFNYKKSPAPATSAVCGAADEAEAFLVATAWCQKTGAKFIGAIRPMVVADPSILRTVTLKADGEAEALPDPVAATTGMMGRIAEGLKTAVGR